MNFVRVTRQHQYRWTNGIREVLKNNVSPDDILLEYHSIQRPRRTLAECQALRHEKEQADMAKRLAEEEKQANIEAERQEAIRQEAEKMIGPLLQEKLEELRAQMSLNDDVQIVMPDPIEHDKYGE